MAGFPANLFPIFCSQGHLQPPSTRALLYFRRLWEVGEIPLSKDLGIPLPIYSLKAAIAHLPQTLCLFWGVFTSFPQCWGLNTELCACSASALLLSDTPAPLTFSSCSPGWP